jgi:cellulose biosynthesis protein BcsQ
MPMKTVMKTVVVVNGKGGVGKSNIITNLAGMATMPGHGSKRVVAIDADPQCTTVDWGANRTKFIEKNPHRRVRPIEILAPQPHPTIHGMIDYQHFRQIHAKCAAAGFDFCFVDTKGLTDVNANEIAVHADMIIVPTGPDEADWAKLTNVEPIITDADMRRGYQVPAFVVLNKVHPSTGAESIRRLAAIASASGIETAPGCLCTRKVVGEAYSDGLCVEEKGTDAAATGDWARLFDLVATILEASDSESSSGRMAVSG